MGDLEARKISGYKDAYTFWVYMGLALGIDVAIYFKKHYRFFHLCCWTMTHAMMGPEAPTNTPMMPTITPITSPILRGVLLHSQLSETGVTPGAEVYTKHKTTNHVIIMIFTLYWPIVQ